ncbi:MAG TPA: UDP-N-acetyl glucosamine 2-epimerase, partial [Candidatus Limnocylindrales bacterium]
FFGELGLARPDHSLGVRGASGAEQVGRMLMALEPVLAAERPDAVLVYGDTNSTLAGGLAAAKQNIPVAHVEAGLRSFDRRMPEELNRVLVDHLSRWLFAPTPIAVANLHAEGIEEGVLLVGDLMMDLVAASVPAIRDPAVLGAVVERLGIGRLLPGRYLFATIHRVDNREANAIAAWTELLRRVARPDRPVILALHPGTRLALERAGAVLGPAVLVVEPLGYRMSLTLQLHAAAVLTDSGGVQREASWLRVPCLVLRGTTEWQEAVDRSGGLMVVVGLDNDRAEAELDRLAPLSSSEAMARARAEAAIVEPAGAADAIAKALAAFPPMHQETHGPP